MRILKTVLVLVVGPILGALLGYFAGILLIHSHAVNAAPIDRVKVFLCAGFGLVLGTSLAVVLMAVTISRKDRKP